MDKVGRMKHAVSWAIALAAFWLLLSGIFQALLLIFGAVSVFLVVLAVRKMDAVDRQPKPLQLSFNLISYLAWLVIQIIKSSSGVARLVWLAPQEIAPALETIPTKSTKSTGSVLFANSITLTPGTLSVDLSNDAVTVHALRSPSLQEIKDGDMEARVIRAAGGKVS